MKKLFAMMLVAAAFQTIPASAGVISFVPYVAIPTGSWPEVVAIGDVNNDGRNDVVLGTRYMFGSDTLNDNKIFVFLQTETGTLETPVRYYAGELSSIDISDLNHDGRADVVVGFLDSVGIFFQDSSSGLLPKINYYSGDDVNGIKCADLNGDSLNDIAVSHWATGFVRIFLQQPYGNFDQSDTLLVSSSSDNELETGDINSDGHDDVVLLLNCYNNQYNIAAFLQDTLGHLNGPTFLGLGDTLANGLAVGDVNSDMKDDIVATYGGNWPSSGYAIWYQDSSGQMQEPPFQDTCFDCPEPVEIGDIDCDGRNDVIIAHGGWNAVGVSQQEMSGTIANNVLFDVPYASHYRPEGMAVGDINNDGKPDIVLADYNNGLVILYNTSTTGVADKPITASQTARPTIRAYPNPSAGTVTISYELSQQQPAAIAIYNVAGQKVRTILQGNASVGQHNVPWDGRDDRGNKITTGTYLCRLSTAAGSAVSRLVVLR